MPQVQKRSDDLWVSVQEGAWHFSFVPKAGSRAYVMGIYAGPDVPEFARRAAIGAAKRAVLAAGYEVVL